MNSVGRRFLVGATSPRRCRMPTFEAENALRWRAPRAQEEQFLSFLRATPRTPMRFRRKSARTSPRSFLPAWRTTCPTRTCSVSTLRTPRSLRPEVKRFRSHPQAEEELTDGRSTLRRGRRGRCGAIRRSRRSHLVLSRAQNGCSGSTRENERALLLLGLPNLRVPLVPGPTSDHGVAVRGLVGRHVQLRAADCARRQDGRAVKGSVSGGDLPERPQLLCRLCSVS
jgi:hypothetical protein